jgi:transposase-like protein
MTNPRPPTWIRCPACHAVSGLLNIGLSPRENTYECEECGHVWAPTAGTPRSLETGKRSGLRRKSE